MMGKVCQLYNNTLFVSTITLKKKRSSLVGGHLCLGFVEQHTVDNQQCFNKLFQLGTDSTLHGNKHPSVHKCEWLNKVDVKHLGLISRCWKS